MLAKYLMRHKLLLALIAVLLIVRPSISAWCGFKAAELFNAAEAGDINSVLSGFAILFVVWIFNSLLQYWYRLARARIVIYAREDVKKELFDALIQTDSSHYSRRDSGNYIATFTNDITVLETQYFDAAIETLEYIATILIIGGSFFALDITLALIILVGGFFSGLIPFLFSRYPINANSVFILKFESYTQRIKEFFTSFLTIKNYSIEKQISERFANLNAETEETKFEAEFALQFVNSLGGALSWFIRFAVVGFGLIKVTQGSMSFGYVMTAYSFSNELATPLQGLIHKFNSVRSVKAIVKKIEGLRDQRHITSPLNNNLQLRGSIEFKEVSLQINGESILDHVTLTLEEGKKYLVLGKNGCGKSTLFKLLKRVYGDYDGRVTIGNRSIEEMTYPQISSFVSYLSEDVDLLSVTVRDNIKLFRDIDDRDIDLAVETVGLRVPLDRVLRDKGANISSGERRRVEIARSLVTGTPTLVFDEVVSTLDIETAYDLEKLALSLPNQTVVFISHNFSPKLVSRYDQIVLMDEGRIVATGTHHELLESSHYYQLLYSIKSGQATANDC